MLTKDLMRYRRRGDYLKPIFIDTGDAKLLEFATELLAVYGDTGGKALTRGEIDELADPIVKGLSDLCLAKGLYKLITDRCEFAQPEHFDYSAMRKKVFLRASQLLRQQNCSFEKLAGHMNDDELQRFAAGDIFADLPENERLSRFRPLFPRELLERYNTAQVQALLMYAAELDIKVGAENAAELRRLFKYLKFFRLLAKIEEIKSPVGCKDMNFVRLQVSGPASMLDSLRKYGMQLAVFFPAVCALPRWSIRAEIKLRDRKHRLVLDEKSGLVSHYRNFSAYVPEEVMMFHRLFKQKVKDWKIVGEAPFIKNGREIFFPDLSFEHESGKVIHLELFHRWHRGELAKRLVFCNNDPTCPLLIGVDRSLLKSGYDNELQNDSFFSEKGFLFRDFPGVDRVRKLLNSLVG
ncbi:DUF790 family protein [Lentisphaerota bacterium ZTH]|nr:DUF790 family protein [Lentisphaerota bacterium]WET06596.1 DUF790 family protein [Lentisphaerota bacterium ZTH]